MDEQYVIVPVSALDRGERVRKTRAFGWVMAALVAIGAAFVAGEAVAYRQARRDLAEASREIEQLQRQQVEITSAFTKAWQEQRRGVDTLVAWGKYLKARGEANDFNINNGPISDPRGKKNE